MKLQGVLEVFLLIPFEGGSLGFWANILKGVLEDFFGKFFKGVYEARKKSKGRGYRRLCVIAFVVTTFLGQY